MSAKSDIADFAVADATFAAAVGSDGSTVKLFYMYVPQEVALPYAIYQRIGGPHFHAYDGATTWQRSTYQFDIYAESPEEMDTVADALIARLDGKRGTIGSTTVQGIFVEGDGDLPEHLGGGREAGWYRRMFTADIVHI